MGPEQEKNKLVGMMLSGNDKKHSIAESESADNSLASTFVSLIDIMDIAMWRLDLDYRVVGYNKKAKEIYGGNSLGDFLGISLCFLILEALVIDLFAQLNSICQEFHCFSLLKPF